MDFGLGSYALGFVAGLLSTLSPCVLPLLPILIATALGQHRRGPMALAAGLMLSFTLVGTFIATLGSAIGLDAGVLRKAAAVLLVVFGALLLSRRAQVWFAQATARAGAAGDGLLARIAGTGWSGQFMLGLGLGLVWSPCVGPTLGAASTLAAQGRHLSQIALLMLLFGLGAATPLLVLGSVSQGAVRHWGHQMMMAGQRGRWLLGGVLIAVGLGVATGWDRDAETWLLDHSPDWLTRLTTRY